MTFDDSLKALRSLITLTGNADKSGCIHVASGGFSAVIKWGECSTECQKFNACVRGENQVPYPASGDGLYETDNLFC